MRLNRTYTTGENPLAPPKPMRTMEKVIAAMTKLDHRLISISIDQVLSASTHPMNPKGVGLAKRLRLSPTRGVFGVM